MGLPINVVDKLQKIPHPSGQSFNPLDIVLHDEEEATNNN